MAIFAELKSFCSAKISWALAFSLQRRPKNPEGIGKSPEAKYETDCSTSSFGRGGFPCLATVFVGSRSALNGNDFIDWGTVGPTGTVLSTPFTITSNNGVPAIVNAATLKRLDQNNGWNGNFPPCDHLIHDQTIGDSITIDLSTGIFGAGAQVQTDGLGFNYTFSGTISAFDQNLNPLGSFTFNGVSNSNADNSAVFAGILDTNPDIYRLVFTANDQTGCAGFLINRLDLVTQSVPEGGTFSLLAVGAASLGLMVFQSRRSSERKKRSPRA